MVRILLLGICLSTLVSVFSPVMAEDNWVFGNTQAQIRQNYGYQNYSTPVNYVPVQVKTNNYEMPDIIKRKMKYEESRNTGDRMLPVKRGSKKPMC